VDTRLKIVESVPVADFDVMEGTFDPLLAAQAREIAERKRRKPLVVVIRDPEEPLLPARARAELVAALREVDFVVIGGSLKGWRLSENREAFMDMIRAKHGR
jgi:hypothetical protein